jgi:hypothetical protein
MTAMMPEFARKLTDEFNKLEWESHERDNAMWLVKRVRDGHMRQMFPAELSLSIDFAGVPIANSVDVFAHDIAEGIAPLPALACVSGNMQSQADRNRADLKNKIGMSFWTNSRLAFQMMRGAQWYITYGFLPFLVEPKDDTKCPFIQVMNPIGSYYRKDRYDNVTVYAHRWEKTVGELAAQFPEHRAQIMSDEKGGELPSGTTIRLVRWIDKSRDLLFMPDREGLVLASYSHGLDRVPVHVAERPTGSDKTRGQFDDVIYVEVARAIMTALTLEAASIAVQAPIAVPRDMENLSVGPHAILSADHPEQIRKINLELPSNVFAQNQALADETKIGSRYPDPRLGEANASVITGKGVEALLGNFDSQIKAAQEVLTLALEQITSICFEMDEKWWPNQSKTVSGTIAGKTYGFAMGMKPAQSVITMLQLKGAGIISNGTAQLNMPFGIDPESEQREIDTEAMREALKQGVFALAQTVGQVAANGQDPTSIIKIGADMIVARNSGQTLEDSFQVALANYQKAQQEAQQAAQQQMQAAGGGLGGPPGPGGPPDGGQGGGPMQGQAPGQVGMPPGGLPTVEHLMAGFRGNASLPVNQATIDQHIATGTP